MTFSKKLNNLFIILKCSNKEIASLAEIDPSLISRFRSDMRIPSINSPQLSKLCNGIYRYIKTYHLENTVNSFLPDILNDDLLQSITDYLCGEDASLGKARKKREEHQPRAKIYGFGSKLNSIMNIFDISNVRMARKLNVDPSLISRYRTNQRNPTAYNSLIRMITQYIYERISYSNRLDELAKMLNEPNNSHLEQSLYMWLTNTKPHDSLSQLSTFLEMFDSENFQNFSAIPNIENITVEPIGEPYLRGIGTDNYQKYVNLFLSDTTRMANSTIKVYSDYTVDFGDKKIITDWNNMIMYSLFKGNTLEIIHSLRGNLGDLLSAIIKWLPIYSNGLIKSYYLNDEGVNYFNHVLFANGNTSAVTSLNVAGSDETAMYHYTKLPSDVEYINKQFDNLLGRAKPLIEIFTANNYDNYAIRVSNIKRQLGNTLGIFKTPSIETMPRELFLDIINSSRSSDDRSSFYFDTWSSSFLENVNHYEKIELFVLPKKEDYLNNRIPINLSAFNAKEELYYTKEQFRFHVNYIIQLLQEYPNYTVLLLDEAPYHDIQFFIKEGIGVAIIKNTQPYCAFFISHPLIINAFEDYLKLLAKEMTISRTKEETIEILKSYLKD